MRDKQRRCKQSTANEKCNRNQPLRLRSAFFSQTPTKLVPSNRYSHFPPLVLIARSAMSKYGPSRSYPRADLFKTFSKRALSCAYRRPSRCRISSSGARPGMTRCCDQDSSVAVRARGEGEKRTESARLMMTLISLSSRGGSGMLGWSTRMREIR